MPFRPMLDRVPTEMWPQIHADVHAALRKYFDGEKVAFGASVVLACGDEVSATMAAGKDSIAEYAENFRGERGEERCVLA